MYVSDKKASTLLAILALVIGPWFGVSREAWGWMFDVLLLLSVLWIGRSSERNGLRMAAFLLIVGYGIAFLLEGISMISRVGFIPWAGLVTVWGVKENWPQRVTVFNSLIAAGIAGLVPVLYLLHQGIPQEFVQNLVAGVLEQYRQVGMLETLEQQGMNEAELISLLEQGVQYFLLLTPGLAVISSLAEWGSVYYFFARWFPQPGQEYKPMTHWRLPWYSLWGANLAILCYLIGDQFQWLMLRSFGINLMLVYGVITFILGMGVFLFYLRSPWLSKFFKAILLITSFIYINVTVIGLVLLGLLDLGFNFRRLSSLKNDPKA